MFYGAPYGYGNCGCGFGGAGFGGYGFGGGIWAILIVLFIIFIFCRPGFFDSGCRHRDCV